MRRLVCIFVGKWGVVVVMIGSVYHLKGAAIHKYLDKYGGDGFFEGKNFVFDQRAGGCGNGSQTNTRNKLQ